MNAETLHITAITPSYNQGRFIGRTIESVLSQSRPPLEYLVFDACSSDQTADVLAGYAGRLTAVIERDGGQAEAVNKGLARARGDVIAWINSDDVYYPGAFEAVLDTFAANPDVDVVYGEAEHIDVAGTVIEPYGTEPFDYERLKDVCFFCQPATFFRRRAVERHGPLRADLRYSMDYELWLRYCAAVPPLFLPRTLAGSRLHADTKTLGSRVPVHREILAMLAGTFGRPPARWVYNLAHAIVEDAGLTRDTPAANRAYVTAMVREARALFVAHGGTPMGERIQMARWLWAARRAESSST
ncbi:MAG: glycosyltransferase [Acidobacteria bacterium]|nr:glycosyltransferase [Acidobacteriota bacterium]